MADWWPLTDLACRAPDPSRRMAWRDDRWLSHADWLDTVGRWQQTFADHAASHWVIYLEDPVSFAAALLAAWHEGKVVIVPGDSLLTTVKGLGLLGYALAGDLPGGLQAAPVLTRERPRCPIDSGMARLQVYTSGSQGQPSAIEKRLSQLVSEVDALEAAFGPVLACSAGQEPTVWATVSHQHIYGLLFLVLWPLAAGRPMAARRLLYPEDLAAELGPRPAVLVATPAHLKRLGEHLDWSMAKQGLRAVFSSGGPLPLEVARSVGLTLGQVPIEVFGSSETGGIAWRQSSRADEAWRPFVDVQWRLNDEGCLVICSPRLPDDQWWASSDRAEPVGSDGFRLLGRSDRIVKIEEKRVSLTSIEQHLLVTPWVQEVKALVVDTPIGARVAVVAVPTQQGREQLHGGRRLLSDLLRHALADVVDAIALPRRWRFVDAFPINAQGKSPEALLMSLFMEPSSMEAATPSWPEMPSVQWLERGETHALAILDIHAGLSVFDGHFDVTPILPGVAQLDWSLVLGRECFAIPERFVRLEALKFVRPVEPRTALKVALQFKPHLLDTSLCSLTFKLYSLDTATAESCDHASGRAIWSYDAGG